MVKSTRKSQISNPRKESGNPQQTNNKIIILPKILVGPEEMDRSKLLITLRTPRNSNGALFLMDYEHSSLYQLLNFSESPRSWFVNDNGYQDGSIMLTTPIDPLFLVLPYLGESNKYRPLDQILVDSNFPSCTTLLSYRGLHQQMMSVADIKETRDLRAYRYNESKCMMWLSKKVNTLAMTLQKKGINVSCGAQAATFVRVKKDANTNPDYMKYAHGLISDYLSEDISEALLNYLGLTSSQLEDEQLEPPAKRPKLDIQEGPIEDYCKMSENGPKKEIKPLTATQKALSKVDKTGMKNISSFFAKKN